MTIAFNPNHLTLVHNDQDLTPRAEITESFPPRDALLLFCLEEDFALARCDNGELHPVRIAHLEIVGISLDNLE